MKQLRPVINRIVKKIPDAKLEALLTTLVAAYPDLSIQAQTDALLAAIKREAELEKNTKELEAKIMEMAEQGEIKPPSFGRSADDGEAPLPM